MELTTPPLHIVFGGRGGSSFILDVPALKLSPGLCFVVGMNGSGKSVMLKLLAGVLSSDRGPTEVRIGADPPRPARVALVQQAAVENVALDLTAFENILLRLKPRGWLDRIRPMRLRDRALGIVEKHPTLVGKGHARCSSLSVGQLQALVLLSVLTDRVDLLLLDEFLAATDIVVSRLLLDHVRGYVAERPASVIIVSHDLPLALSEGDRILVLRNGALIADLSKTSHLWTHEAVVRLVIDEVQTAARHNESSERRG